MVMGLVCGFVFATAAAADVVELKNAQRVEGTFKGADEGSVRIEVGGQSLSFKREQVRAIYFGSAPVAASPAPLAPVSTAIQALKEFDATKDRLSFDEYQRRLQELQAIVTRGEAIDSPARDHLTSARRLYTLAVEFWKIAIRGAGTSVAKSSLDEMRQLWRQAAEETQKAEEAMKGQLQ